MKKAITIFSFFLAFVMTGCYGTYMVDDYYGYTGAEISVQTFRYSYFDYGYSYPVVYIGTIPYYRIWHGSEWVYHAVPRERFPFIKYLQHPLTFRSDMPVHSVIRSYGHLYDRRPAVSGQHRGNMGRTNPEVQNRANTLPPVNGNPQNRSVTVPQTDRRVLPQNTPRTQSRTVAVPQIQQPRSQQQVQSTPHTGSGVPTRSSSGRR